MAIYKEVKKSRPCPICGKPDYCCFAYSNEGIETVICKRTAEQSNVIGADGQFYIFDGVTPNSNLCFEEANQRRAREMAKTGKTSDYNFKNAKAPVVKQLTIVDQVTPKSPQELDKIYRMLLSFLSLEPRDREYLRREGWSDELIDANHIVSFPEKDFTRFKYRKEQYSKNPYRKKLAQMVMDKLGIDNLRGVPGAYRDSNGKWTFSGPSGILFPLYDVNHFMYRLRIRLDFRDLDAEIHPGENKEDDWFSYGKHQKIFISFKGLYIKQDGDKVFLKEISRTENNRQIVKSVSGKYRNFASYSPDDKEAEKGFLVNSYDSGCESGNQIGFYYNEYRDDMYLLYVTEGEKKGIFCNAKLQAPHASIPGVQSWPLLLVGKIGERPIDILKAKGVRVIIVAYDADSAVNKDVMLALVKIVEALEKEDFIIGLAEWDMQKGKGEDDLLSNGYKPSYVLANASKLKACLAH